MLKALHGTTDATKESLFLTVELCRNHVTVQNRIHEVRKNRGTTIETQWRTSQRESNKFRQNLTSAHSSVAVRSLHSHHTLALNCIWNWQTLQWSFYSGSTAQAQCAAQRKIIPYINLDLQPWARICCHWAHRSPVFMASCSSNCRSVVPDPVPGGPSTLHTLKQNSQKQGGNHCWRSRRSQRQGHGFPGIAWIEKHLNVIKVALDKSIY